jgi:TPR repeat protein
MRRVSTPLVAALLFLAVPFSSSFASLTDKTANAMKKGDYKTALEEVRPEAEKGDRDAQFVLGMLYDAGNGVPQDQAVAASWYRKAAEQNHLVAQLFLGVLFYSGQGVKQDYVEAARWFRTPADSGQQQAQFYLGWMHAVGNGVEKDDSIAIHWLTKSAAQQNTRAMGMLATELFSRHRDDQDLVDAYAWSHLAAEMDAIQAMTSARVVIERYCDKDQTKRAKARIA